ncbi:MAG TPA: malonate decarboxylase subunit delta [Candidatus Acidoferrales bacterium]|nr:malonate decarboxylase subunit delta [Candidatus Acidoferrales bacterium]
MIETLTYEYPASQGVQQRAHVGVVASGNCEILLEPAADGSASIVVRTSVTGFGTTWQAVLKRFFARNPVAVRIEINDFGATPAVVALRLEQALESAL